MIVSYLPGSSTRSDGVLYCSFKIAIISSHCGRSKSVAGITNASLLAVADSSCFVKFMVSMYSPKQKGN